jgi:large subunit ribosomal protein L15
MKHIGNLKYSEGAKHKKKRIARGIGSGFGGTSTRGHKGQKSRKSYGHKRGFEGGQMPLVRRIPKFGFNNINRVEYQIVNVGQLQELVDRQKLTNTVDIKELMLVGVIKKIRLPLKILGNGNLSTALQVTAHSFSEAAKKKIEEAGGKVTING